jgi:hypothetical protein
MIPYWSLQRPQVPIIAPHYAALAGGALPSGEGWIDVSSELKGEALLGALEEMLGIWEALLGARWEEMLVAWEETLGAREALLGPLGALLGAWAATFFWSPRGLEDDAGRSRGLGGADAWKSGGGDAWDSGGGGPWSSRAGADAWSTGGGNAWSP